jgi:hypothetical protein
MTQRPSKERQSMILHSTAPTSRLACRVGGVASGGLLVAAALTGCGAAAKGTASSSTPKASSSRSASTAGRIPQGPAASGLIAEIAGTTMQVQNQQAGQVAVTWSGTTKFSHTVSTALASLKPGACVTAVAPSGTSASATAFTANVVMVSPAVNGACNAGRGGTGVGGGRLRPGGQRPSFGTSGRPSGTSARPNFGALASGKVVSVTGSTIVIAAQSFGSATPSTTQKNVKVGSGTKITTEALTTSGALKVGKCVTAQGKADSSGTVSATTVRITDATNGQCTVGFGGRNSGG